jgi:hypothetical protein
LKGANSRREWKRPQASFSSDRLRGSNREPAACLTALKVSRPPMESANRRGQLTRSTSLGLRLGLPLGVLDAKLNLHQCWADAHFSVPSAVVPDAAPNVRGRARIVGSTMWNHAAELAAERLSALRVVDRVLSRFRRCWMFRSICG